MRALPRNVASRGRQARLRGGLRTHGKVAVLDLTQYNKGAGDEAGTWSWDGADDMKLNGYDGAGISAQGNLNIGVTGTNTVTADSLQSAIEVKDGNLAITGEGTLNATAEPQKSRSAVKVECGSLAISGDVTLNATAGTDTIAVSGDGKTGGDVDIRGANVNVTATNKVPHTIGIHTRAGNITINEGAAVHAAADGGVRCRCSLCRKHLLRAWRLHRGG